MSASGPDFMWRSYKVKKADNQRRLVDELPEHISIARQYIPELLPKPVKRTIERMCSWCLGNRTIWEVSILGLVPCICENCEGKGKEYIEIS